MTFLLYYAGYKFWYKNKLMKVTSLLRDEITKGKGCYMKLS